MNFKISTNTKLFLDYKSHGKLRDKIFAVTLSKIASRLVLAVMLLWVVEALAQSEKEQSNKKQPSKQPLQSQLDRERQKLIEDAAQGLLPDGALLGPGTTVLLSDQQDILAIESDNYDDDELVDLEVLIMEREAAERTARNTAELAKRAAADLATKEKAEISARFAQAYQIEAELANQEVAKSSSEKATKIAIEQAARVIADKETKQLARETGKRTVRATKPVLEVIPYVEPVKKEPEVIVREPLVFSGVRLKRTKGQLELNFLADEKISFTQEKYNSADLAVRMLFERDVSFAGGKTELNYDDNLLKKIFVEQAPEGKTRLVIELKSLASNQAQAKNTGLVVRFQESVRAKELLGVRLVSGSDLSRLLLDVSATTRFSSVFRHGELWVLLRNVKPLASLPLKHEDGRLRLEWIKRQKGDTLLKVLVKDKDFVSRVVPLGHPPRLVVDVIGKLPAGEIVPTTTEPTNNKDYSLLTANRNKQSRRTATNRAGTKQALESELLLDEDMKRAQQMFEQGLGTEAGQQAFWEMGNILFRKAQTGVSGGWYRVVQFYESSLVGLPADMLTKYGAGGFYQLGAAYRALGLYKQSDQALLRLKEFTNAPELADTYYLLARNALDRDQSAQAVAWFKQMRSLVKTVLLEGLGATGVGALYWEGVAQEQAGQHAQALITLESALELAPKYPYQQPTLLFGIAEAFVKEGPVKARIFYQRLFELKGRQYYSLLTARAQQLKRVGKPDQALIELAKIRDYATPLLALNADLQIANIRALGQQDQERHQAIIGYQRVLASAVSDAKLRAKASEGLASLARWKAEQLLSEGQTKQALIHFERLLKSAKGRERLVLLQRLGEVQSQLVVKLAKQEAWQTIISQQQELKRRWPKISFSPLALYYTARSFEKQRRIAEATSAYADALRADFGLLRGLVAYQQARLLCRQGYFDRSRRMLERLLRSKHADRHFPDAGLLHAYTLEKIGRYKSAIRGYLALEKRLRLNQSYASKVDLAETLYQLGKLYTSLRQYQKALPAYQQATFQRQPRKLASRAIQHSTFSVADTLSQLGSPQKALVQYQKALSLYPKHARAPWAQYQVGIQWMRLGSFAKARSQFQLVSGRSGPPDALWRSLAREKENFLAKQASGG